MKKILIVEDQKVLRDEVKYWFAFEGYATFAAADGKEGVELAKKHLPDLILCDIMMPEMDGNEVLSELRQNPSTSLIPFVFMTAMSDRAQIRSGMEKGADDYITKPFTRNELLKAVNARLDKADEVHERSHAALQELRYNLITSLPHELRTPLNAILGFGQMLKNFPESFSPEELPLMGDRIYTSANRLYRLIQNYLLYAQLELKKTGWAQRFELPDADEILAKISQKVAAEYKRQDDLIINIEKGIAFIPELEFSKVVEELCDNAFKFSAPGQKVTVHCGIKDVFFTMSFEDHGRGIAAQDLTKIGAFMQFERKLQEQQGFGLGLIISRRIVELFDGTLTIDSSPERGTIIRVTLPGRFEASPIAG